MRKRVLILISLTAVVAYLAALTTSWSQSFFGAEDKKTGTKPDDAIPVMSPADFKNKVNSMSEKNQQSLTQDALDQLKKSQTLGPTPSPSQTPKPVESESKPAVITSEPIIAPSTNSPPSPAPIAAPPTGTATIQQETPTSSPVITTQPNTSSTYTGFGGNNTNQNKPATSPSNASGGGWSIKY